ncbi:Uncharacterised protein g2310 [Pycnogonum litorale]
MKVFAIVLVLTLVCYIGVESLSCLECPKYPCYQKDDELKCPGGKVYDMRVCGCCKRCAKQVGQACEGYLNLKGQCDKGLFCSDQRGDSGGICKY